MHQDPRWLLLERIASSQHLKTSLRLRDFLFYIARCAIRNAPEDATEQQIGIRVFGRPPGYNSSEDSIVRTHARLLRQKLAAYFQEEGFSEELVVEIPKGHYLPVFHERPLKTPALDGHVDRSSVASPQVAVEAGILSATPVSRRRRRWVGIAAAILLILILVSVFVWHPWKSKLADQSAFDRFWRPFFVEDPPLVIFSNALFSGNSVSGLRYASPQGIPDGTYVDTYTGIGEVAAVYNLTRLFDAHQTTFTLKRSLLVTWDEAKLRNLIFIGARVENPSLRVLQPTVDFTMEANPDSAGVVNHHPKPGEPAVYSRPERPLTTDYAIVALAPGVQPGKRTLIFSGLTTFGTQAAVEYLCRPESASEILKQITGPKGEIRPFEAVLQTTIGGGVALQTHLVTIRVH